MSFLVAIFAFGFLIFIHELGHFIAAVQCGIRVEKFSIGFGPRLIGFIKSLRHPEGHFGKRQLLIYIESHQLKL